MHTPSPLKFTFGQTLTIAASGETGLVVSRSEHINAAPQYLLRYKCADGRAVEAWWSQDALTEADPTAAA